MTLPAHSPSKDNDKTSAPPPSASAPLAAASTAPVPASPPETRPIALREPTPALDADAVSADDNPVPEGDDPEDVIDMETLDQILDLDEDDTHEFSRGMAWAYFSQAATTFQEMDDAYAAKDLVKLSSLGHFLKGSSAALGVAKVQASCERVQHYGDRRDEEADRDLSPEEALAKIELTLKRVKVEYAAAEKWLKKYYEDLDA